MSELINLARGAPDDILLEECRLLMQKASEAFFTSGNLAAFQYPPRVGNVRVRDSLAQFLSEEYADTVESDNLVMNGGCSHGLWLIQTAFMQPGDFVFVEEPTYYHAIRMLQKDLNVIGVTTDNDGVIVDELDQLLVKYSQKKRCVSKQKPFWAMVYLVPTFHNPTGTCLSSVRCKQLISVLRKHEVLCVCDDVYNCLAYMEDNPPFTQPAPKRLFSYDNKSDASYIGNVVSNCSFSKLLGPGLRLGWIECPKRIKEFFESQTSVLSGGVTHVTSCIVAEAINMGLLKQHVRKCREVYHLRMKTMCAAIDKFMPNDVHYKRPKGGYFIWLKLPRNIDTDKLYEICKSTVNFRCGYHFSCSGRFHHFIRLSFAYHTPEDIELGVERLGNALKEMLGQCLL